MNTEFIKKHSYKTYNAHDKSINAGELPQIFKQGVITTIFKSEEPSRACNYRSISNLPAISKVLKMLVAEQLVSFLKERSFSTPNNFSFDMVIQQKWRHVIL